MAPLIVTPKPGCARSPARAGCAWAARACLLVLAVIAIGTASAAELTIDIEGLEEQMQEAARSSLALQAFADRSPSPAQIRRLYARGEQEIRNALEPFGYYSAEVDGELEQTDKGFRVLYRVKPGEPVRVREKNVRVVGEGSQNRAVQQAAQRFKPDEGEVFDHAVYEQSKADLESALLDRGFLRAETTTQRVEVSRSANSATINLEWQSGPRFRFGDVRFSESQFSPEFLQRFVSWESDEYYSNDALLDLQQRLVDADYFSTVSVQPNLEDAQDARVPVNVTVAPARRTVYTASLFMSTDTGPGVSVGMDRRWVNRRGHKLNAQVEYAQRLEAYTTGYRIPLRGRNERSLNFGVAYRDEDTDTTQSRTARLAANETRQWHGFIRTLGLQFIGGDFEVAEERRSSNLLFAEGVLAKKQADNFFFPRRGYALNLTARLAPEGLLSDTSFSQITADARWIYSIGQQQRLLLRGTAGAMAVDDFNELPPEVRYFAGGDRSIRGFDYQSLGTVNAEGLVIGGEYLAVASVEYEYYFKEKWGAAVFVDGGDAFRRTEFDLNLGAGLGVRWRSPVGVVRVDFAKPIQSHLADEIRVHLSIGPDL